MPRLYRPGAVAAFAALIAFVGTSNAADGQITYLAAGSPVMKIAFKTTGVFAQPSFLPGPGVGYIWGEGGRFGVTAFPCFGTLAPSESLLLAPHVAFHAFYVNVGLGYEIVFRKTSSSDSLKLTEGYPILTFGFTLPLQAWIQK